MDERQKRMSSEAATFIKANGVSRLSRVDQTKAVLDVVRPNLKSWWPRTTDRHRECMAKDMHNDRPATLQTNYRFHIADMLTWLKEWCEAGHNRQFSVSFMSEKGMYGARVVDWNAENHAGDYLDPSLMAVLEWAVLSAYRRDLFTDEKEESANE